MKHLSKYRVYWVVINCSRPIYKYQAAAVERLGFSAGRFRTRTILRHYASLEALEADAENIRRAFEIVNSGRWCEAYAAILTDRQVSQLPPMGRECLDPWKVAPERMTRRQAERLAAILGK